ncbi:ROK family protein [Pseudopedobacter beijingensis]|uniref:ROK family protein n=1 Tax=Pseudopedobacter beijingensis TaxID=1207056 RepID=A0ABW4IFV0_9SPHI
MKKEFTEKLIGVDIGGSHITVAELSKSNIVKEETLRREKVNSLGDSGSILTTWTNVIKDVIGDSNPDFVKIGIAMPGPFDYAEGISYIKGLNKYDSLYGMNIKSLLSNSLSLPEYNILFRNDAEAFLHGEVIALKIPLELKVIGVTLGTGLGSARSVNGKTEDVFRAVLPMKDSIAEEYISTRWFQRRYMELCGRSLKNVEALLCEKDEGLKNKLFFEFGTHLGLFLNDFAKEENADIIIVGGNIAKCLASFKEVLGSCLENKKLTIYQSTLWEYAALTGAGAIFSGFESLNLVKK